MLLSSRKAKGSFFAWDPVVVGVVGGATGQRGGTAGLTGDAAGLSGGKSVDG